MLHHMMKRPDLSTYVMVSMQIGLPFVLISFILTYNHARLLGNFVGNLVGISLLGS